MTNVGIDLGFFNNKLNFTFDYYVRKTRDILMNLDIPSFMGYNNSPLRNAGVVENKDGNLVLLSMTVLEISLIVFQPIFRT